MIAYKQHASIGSTFQKSLTASLSRAALFLLLCGGNQNARSVSASTPLAWEAREEFPVGIHHPITFSNATHGFVLSGSTLQESYTSDFWIYEESTNSWTDLSETDSAFPGIPRSFGYGVSSTLNCGNSKAYLGFGAAENFQRLTDFWEFDMETHEWRRLADFPGEGRRHPAMNFVEPLGEIHVGLGDGYLGNYNDYWSYNIGNDEWRQLDDFPSSKRHHPYYFSIGSDSYVGLGHSDGSEPLIERDWYRYDSLRGIWNREDDFESYALDSLETNTNFARTQSNLIPLTTEARVAGTQFSVAGSCASEKTLGFILSGDGDNHSTMQNGEFHVFDPQSSMWHSLPPHPGFSRWAPGSFVLQGSSKVYFFGGYDRQQQILFSDLWTIDLKPFFEEDFVIENDESVLTDSESSNQTSSNEETGESNATSLENNDFEEDNDVVEEDLGLAIPGLLEQKMLGLQSNDSSSAVVFLHFWNQGLSFLVALSSLALLS